MDTLARLRAALCSAGALFILAGCVTTSCGYGGCYEPYYAPVRRGGDYYRAPPPRPLLVQPAPRVPVAPIMAPPRMAPRMESFRHGPPPGGGARGFVPRAAPSAPPGRGNRRR